MRTDELLKELENVQALVCKHEHNDCDHNRCMASIGGYYGDECAFEIVKDAIWKINDLDLQEG